MGPFSFGKDWGVLDDEFDFGCVDSGLMTQCRVAVWQTDSTGLNVYKDVRVVCVSNTEVTVENSGNRRIYA